MLNIKNYSVLTKNGFQKFEGIKETEKLNNIKFIFNDSEIIVTLEHLFYVGKSNKKIFRKAKNIKIGHKIDNKKVLDKIYDVKCSNKFYDLVNVENGNHYITSDITSHNCAFIRPNMWDEFADAIFPSQSGLAFKKNILISTANGMNHFYSYIKGSSSRNNTNGYIGYEVKWTDVPRFRADGTPKTNDEFQTEIVAKYGEVYWNQNYGGEFLGSSHTLLSSDTLKQLTYNDPELELNPGLNIFKKPEKGHQYIMAVDSAKDGIDNFGVQITDITNFNFEQVASAGLQIDYLLMPEFIDEWARMYNNAFLIIENNEGAGQSIADQLYQTYEYENLYFDKKDAQSRKNKKYPGFRTTTKSRKLILQTMKTFIENSNLTLHDKGTIDEFFTFIKLGNKYQADEGCKDDRVMSLAITFAPFCSARNFEDMKAIIAKLFEDHEDADDNELEVGDVLSIGGFDDGVDDNYTQAPEGTEQSDWNKYNIDQISPDPF